MLRLCLTSFIAALILVYHTNKIMESGDAPASQAPKEPEVEGFSVLANPDKPALE